MFEVWLHFENEGVYLLAQMSVKYATHNPYSEREYCQEGIEADKAQNNARGG